MVLEANHKIKSSTCTRRKIYTDHTQLNKISAIVALHFSHLVTVKVSFYIGQRRAVVLCLSDISVSEVEGMKVRILLSQGHGPSKQWLVPVLLFLAHLELTCSIYCYKCTVDTSWKLLLYHLKCGNQL